MNDMKYLVKVSQFVNKTFALWVIIFGILGFIFPEIFKLVGPYVPVLLGVVMFGMGLTLSTADFREVVRRPKEVLTGVVAHSRSCRFRLMRSAFCSTFRQMLRSA